MTSDNKQRLVWIDYAKVCSMVLVVFYHTPPQQGAIDTVVGLMRLPAFFLVAGFLFKVEKFDNIWQLVLHRSKQLLVPYFFFFVFFYAVWIFFGRDMAGDTDVEIYEPIIEFVTGRPQTICAPMWFVVCLFSIQIIYYILHRILPDKLVFPVTCLMPFLIFVIPSNSYFMLGFACTYIPFYAFANTFKGLVNKYPHRKLKYSIPLLLIISALLIYYILEYTRYNYLGTVVFTMAGIMVLLLYVGFIKSLAKALKQHKFIETIGKNTIVLLAIQNYIIGVFKILAFKFGGPGVFLQYPILKPIIVIMVFIISYYPIILINKYIPFILGRWETKK